MITMHAGVQYQYYSLQKILIMPSIYEFGVPPETNQTCLATELLFPRGCGQNLGNYIIFQKSCSVLRPGNMDVLLP